MTTDAKEKPKDALPKEGQPSGDKPPEPSTLPEKIYTQDEADKIADEKHSKLDTRIGVLEKAAESNAKILEASNARATAAEEIVAKAEEAKDEAELAAIPTDNADALSLHMAKQAHKQAVKEHEANVATHEKSVAEWATDVVAAKSYKTLQAAIEIVAKPEYAGVKAADLVELTDGSPDKMETLAKKLVGKVEPDTPPDSDRSSGGAGEPTVEQREKMTPEQVSAHPSIQKRIYGR